ncbi:hypothetical protein DFS34DRAFT_592987 [Phlyctochytrium arcticum]|nr:hypothetical protein DFS34DRAFT_592987 [Phlyctochytrium arcticum]
MTVDRSLGEIVVSLFESSELGLRRACALRQQVYRQSINDSQQQGVKQQAPIGLRELDRFLDSQTGDVSTTLHEIWTPVREKLLQVTTDRPKALWICRWLILGKYRQSSITALEDRLASGDHKDAYAASIVFQENANLLNPAEMTPAVRKMVELLQRVGKSGVETKQSFTKLTLACYGIVLDFLGKAAENLESFDIHSLRHICSDFVTISAQYVDSGFSRDFLLSLANSVESSGVERSLPSTDPNQSNQHDVEHLRILCTALNRGLHPRVRNLSKQKYATYIEENKGLTGWTGQITLCCMLSQWRENLMLKIIEDHNLRDILIDLVDKGLETPLLQSSSLVILEYLLDDQIPQKLPELLEAGANQGNQPYSSRLINKLLHGPTSSSVVKTIFDMATTDVGKEGSVALLQQHPQLVTLIYQEMLKDLAGSSLWESTGAPVLLPLLDFPRMLTELCTQLQFKKSTVEQDAIIRRRLVAIMLLDPSSLFVAMIQKIQ